MESFKSKKAVWWSIGVAIVIGGFFLTAILLPSAGQHDATAQPDVRVPAMQNVPNTPSAPNVQLETKEE